MKQNVPTAAIVRPEGVRQPTSSPAPDEEVTEQQLVEKGYTARLLMRILRDLSALRRRWAPRRIDYEDRSVGAGTYERFPHGLGGRVRWWIVDQEGAAATLFRASPDTLTDANTLVLYSSAARLVTIRVEEAG